MEKNGASKLNNKGNQNQANIGKLGSLGENIVWFSMMMTQIF